MKPCRSASLLLLVLHPTCWVSSAAAEGGGFLSARSATDPLRIGAANGVPRIIWSYWSDPATVPKVVQLAQASWRYFAPDYKIHFLNSTDWVEHLLEGEFHRDGGPGFNITPMTMNNRFADWLRVALLATHGGVWMDASIVLTESLDLLVDQKAHLSGVHLDGMLFETSFIAAAKGSTLMRQWREEFQRICQTDYDGVVYDKYLIGLRSRGVQPLNGQFTNCWWQSESPLHEVAHWFFQKAVGTVNMFTWLSHFYLHPCGELWWMRYLNLHVALNSVLGLHGRQPDWEKFGITLQDSRRVLSRVSYDQGFEAAKIGDFLMSNASHEFDLLEARGLKLRGAERRAVEEHRTCEPQSAIGRLQKKIGFQVFPPRSHPPNAPVLDPRQPEL